jgi:hypothetical protein
VTHGDALESANRWLSGKIVEVVTKCETDILHANIEKGLDIAFRFASIIFACFADNCHIKGIADY